MNDFTLQCEGTISLLRANHRQARLWIEDNVDNGGFQPDYPATTIVEHRYVEDLVRGIQAAGFTIGGAA